jgi:predicted O-linked N-acetylglucosamine transferase (SPINDLY family)
MSRLGVTVLNNGGLPELVTKDVAEYIDLAVNLAQDKERVRGLRNNLRQKIAASPLMNQERFARNMESAYREMWRKWCHES